MKGILLHIHILTTTNDGHVCYHNSCLAFNTIERFFLKTLLILDHSSQPLNRQNKVVWLKFKKMA